MQTMNRFESKVVVVTSAGSGIDAATARGRLSIGRAATPNAVAGAIVFLASNDASFVNSVILSVDGGLHASNGQPNFFSLLGQVEALTN